MLQWACLADWAFILGWRQKPECFNGHASPLGFSEWAYEPIFQTLSVSNIFEKLMVVFIIAAVPLDIVICISISCAT